MDAVTPLPSDLTITDGQLVLRPLAGTADERQALLPLLTDPAVRRWLFELPATTDAAGEFIATMRAEWEQGEPLAFAVVMTDELVAAQGFQCPGLPLAGILRLRDFDADSAKIGWMSTPVVRGSGVLDRAVTLLADWTTDQLGLKHLDALIDRVNYPSRALARRCGFRMHRATSLTEVQYRRVG